MANFVDGFFTITSPIQHKRGTTEALEQSNYIPAAGEIVIATDTGLIKAGDGVHTWSELKSGTHDTSALEARIAALENILSQLGLTTDDSTQPAEEDSDINQTLDDIFAGNYSEPSTSDNDNGFDDSIDSIFNS